MKKILGIMGSPRKEGNTHILVSKILEGAMKEGAQTNIILLGDLNISECDGCHICWEGKECSKHDDMNKIYPQIIESDAIIFGTPIYWYGPTALMKAFIDRFVYFNCPENRARIKGKSVAIAIPFEEENFDTALLLIQFFEKIFRYLQMNLIDQIIVPSVSQKGDIIKKEDKLLEAYELGRRIAKYH